MHYLPVHPVSPPSPLINSITSLLTWILTLQPQKLILYLLALFYSSPLPLLLLILYLNNDITCLFPLIMSYIATMHIRNPNKLPILHIVSSSLPPHIFPIPATSTSPYIAPVHTLTLLACDTHNTQTSLPACLITFLASITLLPLPFSSVDTLLIALSCASSAPHTIPITLL